MRRALLFALALLAGCADASARPASPAPTHHTAGGVPVVAPSWAVRSENFEAALAEIDAACVPLGWVVRIEVPVFECEASPTGIARGLCDYGPKVLVVGWRAPCESQRPVLPALAHEVGHAVTGDPLAGHR